MAVQVSGVPRMDVLPATLEEVYATLYVSADDLLFLLRGEETPFLLEGIEELDVGSPRSTDYQEGISFCFYEDATVHVGNGQAQVQ